METVKDIMTTKLHMARDDWTLEMLSQFFLDRQISGAPVIDGKEQLVGIVSLSDLARQSTLPINEPADTPARTRSYYNDSFYHHGLSDEDLTLLNIETASSVSVRNIMTPMIFEVDEDTNIGKAADIMLKGHIHRLFVTREKKVVGVVTTMDMLKVIRDRFI